MLRKLLVAGVLLLTVNLGTATADSSTEPERSYASSSDIQWLSSTEVARSGEKLTSKPALRDLDEMPQLRIKMYPDYPAKAKKLAIETDVVIQALVDADGYVQTAKIAEPSEMNPGIGFERAALVAAMESSYHPGILNGKPVSAWVTYTVAFRLD